MEPPTRSILGLGRIEPSPLRVASDPSRSNGEPPTRTLLGLQGLVHSPLRPAALSAAWDGSRPTRSLLGLEGIRPAPIRNSARLAARPPEADEPPTRGILALGAIRPMPGVPPPTVAGPPEGDPASRSFFGLQALPYVSRPVAGATRGVRPAAAPVVEVPEFEKDLGHRAEPAFPLERAILGSLAAHVLLIVLLLSAPPAVHDPSKGLLAPLVPSERIDEEKIPIIFKEAPGPARENPKKSDLSDADRRAGGGDRSKPRAQSPFVGERQGKSGLLPGPQSPSSPPRAEAGRGPDAPSAGEAKARETADPTEGAFAVPRSTADASTSPGGRTASALQGINQAIRDAARGVGAPGEDGAGFPNPGGGFVDSGPLSFDTTWYDWGPYAAEMVRRIKNHWNVPELARFGWKGKVTIRFFILADGRVEAATILSRSGTPPFDFAALQAIVTSSPFRPLPADLGSEREGVTVTFFYNIRPGEEGGSGN
ncbi:MAG: TonB family protein [Thermoanaerobaculia bacterium]